MINSSLFNRLKALALILNLAFLLGPSLCHASTAIVANQGFETGTGNSPNTPVGWATSGGTANQFVWINGTAGVAGTTVHSGSGAVSITGAVAGGGVSMRWLQLAANAETVTAGEVLQVSAWIKGTDSVGWDLNHDGYRFTVEFLNSANTVVGTWTSGPAGLVSLLTAANSWNQYSATSTPAPVGAVTAKLSLFFGRTTGSTSSAPVITFDDVAIIQSAPVANYSFDTGSGTPSNWATSGGTANQFVWVNGTAGGTVHSGTGAVSITGATPGGGVTMRWLQLAANAESVTAGEVLQVSAWIKGTDPVGWDLNHDGYRFTVEFLNSSNTVVGTWYSGPSGLVSLLTATNSWNQYSATSTPAPAGTVTAKLSLFFGRTTGSTSSAPVITFDDVAITAINLAYPEPMASWTPTDFANQETAAANLITMVAAAPNGSQNNPTIITVAPGNYRFDSIQGNVQANTFLLQGRHDISIQATGATFWFNPFYRTTDNPPQRRYGIQIEQCDHVSITGVTIDYTVSPYSQGQVTAINSSTGAVTFVLDPGFSAPDIIPSGDTEATAVGGKILFTTSNGSDAAFMRVLLDDVDATPGVVDNSDGTYTVTPIHGNIMFQQWNLQNFLNPAAPTYVSLAPRKGDHAVLVDQSTNTVFTGVTVYSSPQMGLTERDAAQLNPAETGVAYTDGGSTYLNCSVVPRPNTSRILSTNADGFHSLGMRWGPNIQGCELGWTGDDNMNIHGLMDYVYSVDGNNGVQMLTQLVPDLGESDTIRFYTLLSQSGQYYLVNPTTPNPDVDTNVLASPTPMGVTYYQNNSLINAANAALDKAIPAVVPSFSGYPYAPLSEFTISTPPTGVGAGWLTMRRDQIAAGTVIQNNYFHDTVGRGIILNSDNGLINGNRLSRIGICSILVAPDNLGLEGPYSRGTIIENNVINNSGFSSLRSSDSLNTVIGAISVAADSIYSTLQSLHSAEHQNIKILNNQITNPVACGIYMSDVTNGSISGNTITNPYYFGTGPTYGDGPPGVTALGAAPGNTVPYFNTNIDPYFAICAADCIGLSLGTNTVVSTTIPLYMYYGY